MKGHITIEDHVDNFTLVKIKYEQFVFPGGEVQVRILAERIKRPIITANILDSEDLMTLLLLSNALDKYKPINKKLILEYIPYSRQDRVCYKGEAFSLEVFAQLINSMNFNEVRLTDPHSNVAELLINNAAVTPINLILGTVTPDLVVCPDQGAIKRTEQFCYINDLPYIQALKVRDPKTGNILRTEVLGDVENKTVLIVDDICDGGRTFIELAKVLYEKKAKEVNLQVTHGLFSKTKTPLYEAKIRNINAFYDYSEKINVTT